MQGSTLSHFEISAKIGDGGMGEVYQAKDLKLGRQVAIKVLSDSFVADADRLARFEREARVLASLSHPNIAGIFEVGEQDGTHFLVMELAAGQTLGDLLALGPIAVDEALSMALQVARALETAHERGIVHRDLKPANIMIDESRQLKVLDFGLAKTTDPESAGTDSSSELTRAPTTSDGETVDGAILGTAAYMSPEQAKGRVVDRRADIWAFGVVLYEILTGKSLFAAPSPAETLACVLVRPIDLSDLPQESPPALRRLVERCLVREPTRRLRDLGDAGLELELARRELKTSFATADEGQTAGGFRRREIVAWTFAALSVFALLAVFFARTGSSDLQAVAQPIRFEVGVPGEHTLAVIDQQVVALSPDGRCLAFVALDPASSELMLFVRPMDSDESLPVAGSEGASSPTFSPAGDQLAFFADRALWRIPIEGGRATRIADAPNLRGLDWAADGSFIYSPEFASGLWRLAAGADEPVVAIEPDAARGERSLRWPDVSPDGRRVLFTIGGVETPNDFRNAKVAVADLQTGDSRVLVEQASMAQFVPPDHMLYNTGGRLFLVGLDLKKLTTVGEPSAVVDEVAGDPSSGIAYFTVASNGDMAYVPGAFSGSRSRMTVMDLGGDEIRPEIPGLYAALPSFSPDGRRVVFAQGSVTPNSGDIWTYSLADRSLHRVSFGDGSSDTSGIFSADGTSILFTRFGAGILRQPSDGGGVAEPYTQPLSLPGFGVPASLSPDGRTLAYVDITGSADIYLVREDEEPVLFESNACCPEFSPDGRWIAFQAPGSGDSFVFVRPVEGSGRWQVSPSRGAYPRWAASGRQLYYIDTQETSGSLMRVSVETGYPFRAGPPEAVLEDFGVRALTGNAPVSNWDIDPPGRRVVFVELDGDDSEDQRIRVVHDWISKSSEQE